MSTKKILQSTIEVFEDENQLDPTDAQLLKAAKEAISKSYAPYSKFHVSAAALLEDGQIVSGANQENAAFPMCMCAEQVVIAAVKSNHPNNTIKSMAITIQKEGEVIGHPASPCGSCRQILVETEERANQDIRLIIQGETGEVWVLPTAKVLLPFYFNSDYL